MIGDKRIDIHVDDILIDGKRYKGTPGLYELIVMNIPNDYIYTEEDLNAYADMLRETNVYRVNYSATGKIRSNRGSKYKNIIAPLINRVPTLEDHHMSTYSDLVNKEATGSGINLTNTAPNYVYFNDPNELVDELRLLLASQQAGNTGHSNEINSIIEELLELEPVLSKNVVVKKKILLSS
ncbi:hypothetical protein J6590_108657 [Homalodisca vitripennis]|nr:hypothetical protein J6590_108657 [Homalodisca vitripennis]